MLSVNKAFWSVHSELTDCWAEEQRFQLGWVVFLTKPKINAGSYEEVLPSLKSMSLNTIYSAMQLQLCSSGHAVRLQDGLGTAEQRQVAPFLSPLLSRV